MLDAVVGAVIVIVATTALALAVTVVESSIGSTGRQPLSSHEIKLLQQAGRGNSQNLQLLEAELQALPRELNP